MTFMRPAFLLLTIALMLATTGAPLNAFVAPHYTARGKNALPIAIQQRVIRPTLYTPASPAGVSAFNKNSIADPVRARDTVSDAPRLLNGPFNVRRMTKRAGLPSYEKVARSYISQNPEVFGVTTRDIKLVPEATLLDADVQFIRFNVYRNGLQVADAHISFRFKQGQLVQVANYSFAEAVAPGGSEHSGLEEKVRQLTGAHRVQDGEVVYRVVLGPEQKSYDLVKVHNFKITTHLGSFTAQIGTHTAKLFEVRDNDFHIDNAGVEVEVNADVHRRWYNEPLEHKKIANLGVTTSQGPVYTPESALEEPEAVPHLDGLVGKFVTISPQSGDKVTKNATQMDHRWVVDAKKQGNEQPWMDKNIAQWMVYHHTDAVIRRAKKYVSHAWLNDNLQANVNLTRTCNAHWDGSTINLYSGSDQCSNTGNIADVVYHEWGHGLDDKTGGIADGAFSEGYGDIIALVMTHSNLLGIGFRVPDHSPVRDLAPLKKYPDDQGEVHAEGLIIASTFWDLFSVFKEQYGEDAAGELIATYAFKMIFTANTYLDVYQALLVIDDNDTTLTNGTPNLCTINQVFTLHGLATKDESCTLAKVERVELSDSNGNGVIEPGEQISLGVYALNKTSQVLNDLKGELSLIAGSHVTVTQAALSWPSLAAGASAKSNEAAVLTVDAAAPCGSTFATNLLLSATNRKTALKQTYTIGKNAGTAASFDAAGLPQPINDNSTTTAVATVSGEQWSPATGDSKVESATVKFTLDHSYVGDLSVVLQAPNGAHWEIYRGSGRGRNVTFEKDLSELVHGTPGKGEWQLKVSDRARRDQGTLKSFQLTLTPSIFVCAAPLS